MADSQRNDGFDGIVPVEEEEQHGVATSADSKTPQLPQRRGAAEMVASARPMDRFMNRAHVTLKEEKKHGHQPVNAKPNSGSKVD